jgi:hypothetical protein
LQEIDARGENPARMNGSYRLAVAALGLALGCAGAPPAVCDLLPPAPEERYAGVEVTLAPDLGLDRGAAARVAAVTRQSALDWLEQRGRLAPEGGSVVEVVVDSARRRSALATIAFAWVAPPDHLSARVALRRGAARTPRCPIRVESALSGWSWRDPDPRLDRLARRLGQRVAEGL